MPPATEHTGLPAAPGVASGPLIRVDRAVSVRESSSDPARERANLRSAIDKSISALGTLADTVDGEAAEIIEFQIAMLEDDVLSIPALDKIDEGACATTAWSDAIATQVADYQATEDTYFKARVADLIDIRDRVLRCLAGEQDEAVPDGAILAGEDLTPSRFLAVDWSKGGGIVLSKGSPSSHVAMLARSRGVPMVVGVETLEFAEADVALVDGEHGRVVLNPTDEDRAAYAAARRTAADRTTRESAMLKRPALTIDGTPVRVMINVAGPEELRTIDPAICDGIGLVRTEFLFQGPAGLPDEDTQFRAYRRIVEWADGRPVVLRTLDVGGDKPVPGLTLEESNPFLGTRGIRLSLARPEIFAIQLRAMVRAAFFGDVKIMVPMVTIPEEIDRAAELLEGTVTALRNEGVPCRRPDLGIMVEVPAVAIEPALYAQAAFFSIGSNDLTQYTTASARDISTVARLNDPGHPAVLKLIERVAKVAAGLSREVSLCGDMGGDPAHTQALLNVGIRTLSVAPSMVGRIKLAISEAKAGSHRDREE